MPWHIFATVSTLRRRAGWMGRDQAFDWLSTFQFSCKPHRKDTTIRGIPFVFLGPHVLMCLDSARKCRQPHQEISLAPISGRIGRFCFSSSRPPSIKARGNILGNFIRLSTIQDLDLGLLEAQPGNRVEVLITPQVAAKSCCHGTP